MNLHIMPFGAPAWQRRREILKTLIAARPGPPCDYRDALYLVPNERSVRTMRALFLDALHEATGSRACVPPAFIVLNKFIGARVAGASGKPFIDGLSRTLAIEEAVRRAAPKMAGQKLSGEILGPSIAPMAADALDKIYLYGVEPAIIERLFPDSLPLGLLLAVKKEYERWLNKNGLSDMGVLKAGYAPGPDDFQGISAVVFDGFYDADPAELRVMGALAAGRQCDFLLEAPGLTADGVQDEGMPYHGAKELIDTLMRGQPWPSPEDERAVREAKVLSGAVFEGVPLRKSLADIEGMKPATREISITGALNPVEEVHFIAGKIKSGFLEGKIKNLNRVLVFFPVLDPYTAVIKEAFNDYGIPFHISEGDPLIQSPVVTAFLNLLSVPVDDYSFRALRKIFFSPLIRLCDDGNRAEEFDRLAREDGITSGRRRWQRAVDDKYASRCAYAVKAPLGHLLALLGRIEGGPRDIGEWVDVSHLIIDKSGMAGQAGRMAGVHPELAAGLEGLYATLSSIKEAAAVSGGRASLARFLGILRRELRDMRIRPSRDTARGVRVLGRLEVMSEPFDVIFAGGLAEGALPRKISGEVIFTEGVAEKLGLPGPAEKLRRDARLFLRLMLSAPVVFLCYPEGGGDGSDGRGAPSPYIRALEPFVRAHAIKRDDKWRRPADTTAALGPSEFLRAMALGFTGTEGEKSSVRAALETMPADTPGIMMAKRALSAARPAAARAAAGRPASLNAPGDIRPGPPEKHSFTVTELEEYILCHYRYYQDKVAGNVPPEGPEDDIAPHEAGSLIHGILRDFYDGGWRVTYENKADSLDRLRDLAHKRFERLPDTLVNRELRRRFIEFLAPRFIETECYLALTDYRVCQTERMIEVELPDTKFGHITITGKIDRVELDSGGNFNVVDYKTGSYPGSDTGGRPLSEQFQLPIYAYMLGEKDAGPDGKKPRPAGFVYYDLKGTKMRDVVAYDYEVYPPQGKKPSTRRKKSRDELESVIRDSMEKALAAARGILERDFRPTCDKKVICEACVYALLCERGPGEEPHDEGAGGESDEG